RLPSTSPSLFSFPLALHLPSLPSFPTRRSSDLGEPLAITTPLLPALFRGPHDENRLLQQFRQKAPSLGLGVIPHRRRLLSKLLQDRKSTRLNSSHVAISYAVFCLKKKKKTRDRW